MAVDLTKSRRALPAHMTDLSTYSILSVLKQALGKDLTRFAIPVIWNEPLSFLQRLAECFQYSSLLDRAALTDNSIERFHLIAAFVVSNLSTHLERTSKPFNPLLGETYELKNEGDAPFHYVAEQVSHHPPISAFHCRGQNWTLTANMAPKVTVQKANVVAITEGRWILRLLKKSTLSRTPSQSSFHSCADDDDDESFADAHNNSDGDQEYTWKSPTVVVHNILFGRMWSDFQGPIEIEHTNTNRRAVITFKAHSWFASHATKAAEMFKYSGYVYDHNDKISGFHGNYGHCYYAVDDIDDVEIKTTSHCEAGGTNSIHLNMNESAPSPCDLFLTPSSRLIWYRNFPSMTDEETELRSKYFLFTPFTMCLNEDITSSTTLPLTDCRYRQDMRHLENGDIDAASAEKHRLEEQQRAEAREREGEFQALWFKKDDNGEYVFNNEYEQKNFNRSPNLFSKPFSTQ